MLICNPSFESNGGFRRGPFLPHSASLDYFNITVNDNMVEETSLAEIYMTESLLSPVLATSVVFHDTATLNKNLDDYKGAFLEMSLRNPNIDGSVGDREQEIFSSSTLNVRQPIYRIENRTPMNYNSESFTLQACDDTLLNNARTRISFFWNCTNPGMIAEQVLACIGAKDTKIEMPSNIRNYQAQNIHPFQIVAEQADFSVNGQMDPSFLHFMTYRNFGTHHFQSMQSLAQCPPVWSYYYNEKGLNDMQIGDPHNIMQYSFPCEFDLLSDIMNGLDFNPEYKTTMIAVNPFTAAFNLIGGTVGGYGCGGIGGVISGSAFTNKGSSEDDGCETMIEQYLHLRPPRMALLQGDKISLKIVVPFNHKLHAGDMIDVKFYAKRDGDVDYGSGNYLIVNMTHNIKPGAAMYATTTLECVARSVSQGEV